jgi:hypothetical protein
MKLRKRRIPGGERTGAFGRTMQHAIGCGKAEEAHEGNRGSFDDAGRRARQPCHERLYLFG